MNTWHVLLSCCSIRAPRARWGPPEEWVPSSARRRFFSRRIVERSIFVSFRIFPLSASAAARRSLAHEHPVAHAMIPSTPDARTTSGASFFMKCVA